MLDRLAERAGPVAATASSGPVGEVLPGQPLGHPLHPALGLLAVPPTALPG